MALVVCNGQQWDSERLPADVNPDDCVPIEEWYRANRSDTSAPAPVAEPDVKPAKRATKRKD